MVGFITKNLDNLREILRFFPPPSTKLLQAMLMMGGGGHEKHICGNSLAFLSFK
jgi:hypothetical protein